MIAPPASSSPRVAESAYGYFDVEAGEYVITRPDTPTPWMNYLGHGRYGGIVSNTGGGYSFDRDPRNRRVSRYRYNAVPADQPGRYVYVRDEETGEFWSPTWQPIHRPLDSYECRHGAAYTTISSAHGGIEATLRYFVPPAEGPAENVDDNEAVGLELWVLRLRNDGQAPRRLRTFSYVEFSLPDALNDLTNLDWAQHILFSDCREGVIRTGTKFNPLSYFMGSTEPPAGFTCDREDFVGRGRDLSNPIVVETGRPSNRPSPRGNSIGSLCHEISLAPGEERQIVFVVGATEHPELISTAVARFSDPVEVGRAFAALRADWQDYLSRFQVETPDADTNVMLNVWNRIQCRTTLYWSRFVSAYETGMGRGLGVRDSAQDTLATAQSAPDAARDTLLRLLTMQFADGHTWHQFYPLTGEGGPGLAAEHPDWPQWFSDDHLWVVIAICTYLRETGDFDFLDTAVRYQDHRPESAWRHLLRAIAFTRAHLGPHGLPRSGFSDWNDTLNVDHGSGKAESVWTAMQLCRALLDLADVGRATRRGRLEAHFRRLHAEMSTAIEEHAWDGDWYLRSFDDDGRPIGASGAAHQAIDLIPQSWSAIGELPSVERANRAMESADRLLDTAFGLRLIDPPYDGFDARVAGTSTYVPGAKENGGIFCHANAWSVVAAAMLGRGDDAYRYYRQVLPPARRDVDVYQAEPYVYSQNVCGPAHPSFGLARNAWLTGTAAWTYVAATQWILGIRPEFEGLRIAPAMPSEWSGFRARRLFRGCWYEISARRAVSGETPGLTVDGQPVSGDVVPLPVPGTRSLEVELLVG